jgi:uncharacterized membrane protein (UPF0127 family)
MKWLRLIVVGCLIGLGASTFARVSTANPNVCTTSYRHDTTVKAGDNLINVEVPENGQKKEIGLGGRPCIGADEGMLFVFSQPGQPNFWMKNMKFPIDIIWIDENKIVTKVDANIAPSTYPKTFNSEKPAKYVLELRANRAQQLNIADSTQLAFTL